MRGLIVTSLLAAMATSAAGPATADSASGAVPPPPGRILYHIDAMYDPQGNLIADDIPTTVSADSLYWKEYNGTTLMVSGKVTNPVPVDGVPMTFLDGQSTPCVDPRGAYVYEIHGTTLRTFSTVDGSHTDHTLAYSGADGCATDGTYIYRSNGTTIYKYTVAGDYVNRTTIDISCDAYSLSVCKDMLWCTNNRTGNVTLYGYQCARFAGGSISHDATWSVGTGSFGVGNVAFDGQYYYVPWIGSFPPMTFKRFYANRSLYTTGTVSIDSRSVMCTIPHYEVLDDALYWKRFNGTALMVSEKETNPVPVNVLPLTFLSNLSTPCLQPDGANMYEVDGTTLRRFSTVDGTYTDFALVFGGGRGCATDGTYIYRPSGTSIYKYTLTGGHISTTTINISCDALSVAVCGDMLWCTNDRYNGVNLYGYACSRFNGGSIAQDVIWNVGTGTNGVGNAAFDGQYYYVPWIGTSPITFKRFRADRTLYTTGTVSIDSRSVMCTYAPGAGVEAPEAATSVAGWLAVAPNPVRGGVVMLRYTLAEAGEATAAVFDLAGRRRLQEVFPAQRDGLVRLELQNLNAGVYWVKLSSGGFECTQRLLIVR